MRILIAGAGEVGRHLAKLLAREDHNITLMDADSSRLQDLDMYDPRGQSYFRTRPQRLRSG